MAQQDDMLIIGLMSGTSADGIDAALVEIEGEGRGTTIRLLRFVWRPYAPPVRDAILNTASPNGRVPDLCALDFALGELLADAAIEVAAAAGVPLDRIEAVASHGHTVWHEPVGREVGGRMARGTFQIGRPAVIADRTGCTVIADFRSADVAAGGQGAPLVPYFDWAVLTSESEDRAVLNLGGIANVTYLPRGAGLGEVVAFDTGPGNMVIDALAEWATDGARRCDEDGRIAAAGQVNWPIVDRLIAEEPYFAAPPPKSTGRELFGGDYADRLRERGEAAGISAADVVATATALTADSVARALRDFLPGMAADCGSGCPAEVIVGGGGCHNPTLMAMLAERLAPTSVTTQDELGVPGDAKEAIAFALLGYETLHGRPSNVPSATGAVRPVVLGSTSCPSGCD